MEPARGEENSHNLPYSLLPIYILAFLRSFIDVIVGNGVVFYARLNGTSDFVTSLVISSAAFIYMATPVILGYASDRIGRRKAVMLSLGINFASQVIYMGFWNAVDALPIETIVILFVIGRLNDGTWLGLYWPVLQGRVSDQREYNEAAENQKNIRHYNLSWNGGLLVSLVLFAIATIPPSVKRVLANLYILLVISTILFIICIIVATASFRDVPVRDRNARGRSAVGQSVPPRVDAIFVQEVPEAKETGQDDETTNNWRKKLRFDYLGALLWATCLGIFTTTLTNHFSLLSLTTPARNFLPFIMVGYAIRIIFQLVGGSTLTVPANPREKYLQNFMGFGLCFLLLGILVIIWPGMEGAGLFLFLVLLAPLGYYSGHIYGLIFARILEAGENKTGGKSKAGFLMGVYESIIGVGFTVGPPLSGGLSEALYYAVPYFAGSVISAIFIFLLFFRRRQIGMKKDSSK